MKCKKNILFLILFFYLSIPVMALEPVKYTPKDNSPEAIFKYLKNAVQLIEREGEKAYEELTDPEGPWVDGNWYIFVNNFDGYNVAHLNKKFIGIRFFAVRDIKGNAFFAELQKEAMSEKGRGVSEYWWPKPGETIPSRKIGFVMRVPNQRLWLSTGVYDMSDKEIEQLMQKISTN